MMGSTPTNTCQSQLSMAWTAVTNAHTHTKPLELRSAVVSAEYSPLNAGFWKTGVHTMSASNKDSPTGIWYRVLEIVSCKRAYPKEGREHNLLQRLQRKKINCGCRRHSKMRNPTNYKLVRVRAITEDHTRLQMDIHHNNSMWDILTLPFAFFLKYLWSTCALSGSIAIM